MSYVAPLERAKAKLRKAEEGGHLSLWYVISVLQIVVDYLITKEPRTR